MVTVDAGTAMQGARAARVRRFRHAVAVGMGVLGVALLAGTGVAFLATNGTSSATVTAGGVGANHEYSNITLPGDTLPNGVNWAASGSATAATSGAWAPILNQPVAASSANDIAIIDGTGVASWHNLLVTLTLSNVVGMSTDYSYANIPITVKTCSAVSGACVWGAASDVVAGSIGTDTLNLTNGYLTFLLAGGANTYYEIESVGSGGSFYLDYTNGSPDANLSPSYQVSVAPA